MAEQVYVIEFDGNAPADRKRCLNLYACFVAGGNKADRKGIEIVRRESVILGKFEEFTHIDRPADLPPGLDGVRVLDQTGGRLELKQPEYELIKRYIEAVVPRIETGRDWLELVDWFASLRPQEPRAEDKTPTT